jgi:EAL domain-containing protein (putative c-di-GMP-specific phosphodiesterase class I)
VLDDFGVGQSSLASLRDFPLDAIKLDRGFMRDLAAGPQGVAIVRAIVQMARALDLAVVAEGIETDEQAEAITELGCDVGQGFLFARPVTPDRLAETIAAVDATLQRRPDALLLSDL